MPIKVAAQSIGPVVGEPSTSTLPSRREPGPHATRPLIGESARRAVAAMEAVFELNSDVSTHQALEQFCASTAFCSASDLKAAVVREGVRLCRNSVNASEVRARMETAFEGYTPEASDFDVDHVVVEINERGLPGEAIVWAVITIESLNHVALIRKEAHKAARVWARQAEDLETYAWRGLRLALRSYSPEQWMFSTYACPKIRGSIHDGVRSEHHLPKRLTTFVNKVERERDVLSVTLGRRPSLEELAGRVGVHLDKLKTLPQLGVPTSLDERDDEHGGHQVVEDFDIGEAVELRMRNEAIREALTSLSPEVAQAVEMLVVDGCSYAETRRRTGVSHRQLRARKERGLEQLAETLAAWN